MMGVFEVGGIISETTFMKKVRDIRTVIPDKEKCWLIERANFSCMYMTEWFEDVTQCQLSMAECSKTLPNFSYQHKCLKMLSNVNCIWLNVWKCYPMSVVYSWMFENVTQCQLYMAEWFEDVTLCQLCMAECLKMLPNVSCIRLNVWKRYPMSVVYGRMFENVTEC